MDHLVGLVGDTELVGVVRRPSSPPTVTAAAQNIASALDARKGQQPEGSTCANCKAFHGVSIRPQNVASCSPGRHPRPTSLYLFEYHYARPMPIAWFVWRRSVATSLRGRRRFMAAENSVVVVTLQLGGDDERTDQPHRIGAADSSARPRTEDHATLVAATIASRLPTRLGGLCSPPAAAGEYCVGGHRNAVEARRPRRRKAPSFVATTWERGSRASMDSPLLRRPATATNAPAPARRSGRISDAGTAFDGGAAASAMVAFL